MAIFHTRCMVACTFFTYCCSWPTLGVIFFEPVWSAILDWRPRDIPEIFDSTSNRIKKSWLGPCGSAGKRLVLNDLCLPVYKQKTCWTSVRFSLFAGGKFGGSLSCSGILRDSPGLLDLIPNAPESSIERKLWTKPSEKSLTCEVMGHSTSEWLNGSGFVDSWLRPPSGAVWAVKCNTQTLCTRYRSSFRIGFFLKKINIHFFSTAHACCIINIIITTQSKSDSIIS